MYTIILQYVELIVVCFMFFVLRYVLSADAGNCILSCCRGNFWSYLVGSNFFPLYTFRSHTTRRLSFFVGRGTFCRCCSSLKKKKKHNGSSSSTTVRLRRDGGLLRVVLHPPHRPRKGTDKAHSTTVVLIMCVLL